VAGLESPDWASLFVPDKSLFESFLRGTVVYFAVLILVRVFPKRQIGSVGLTDILLLVLLSECVSQVLNANSVSLGNGIVAVAALMFWNFLLDRLSFHWAWLERLLEPKPVVLIRDGALIEENLRSERLSNDELYTQLRQHGFDDISRIKLAMIESEGKVSVVPTDQMPTIAIGDFESGATDFDRALQRFLSAAQSLRSSFDRQAAQTAGRAHAAGVGGSCS
jgi:uncharacterized membrane protein YcaP (DUF421 family)